MADFLSWLVLLMLRFKDRGKFWNFFFAGGNFASARRRSLGSTIAPTASSEVHDPSRLAAFIFFNPAAVICPNLIARATRVLFSVDHSALLLLGANQIIERSESRALGLLSIQPKHNASSTVSS